MNWKERLEAYLRDSCGVGLSGETACELRFSEEDADMLMYVVDEKKSREEIMETIDWINGGKTGCPAPDALRGYIDEMKSDSAVIGAFLKGYVRITDEMRSYGLDMDLNTRDMRKKWLSYIASVSNMTVDGLREYGRRIIAGMGPF